VKLLLAIDQKDAHVAAARIVGWKRSRKAAVSPAVVMLRQPTGWRRSADTSSSSTPLIPRDREVTRIVSLLRRRETSPSRSLDRLEHERPPSCA
jgi:hypothetical protein